MKKAKYEYTRTHTDTWYLVSHDTWYCVFERKHSAARHSTASQGEARHHTAPHGAALRAAKL